MEQTPPKTTENTEIKEVKTAQDYFGYENPIEEISQKVEAPAEDIKTIQEQINEILPKITVDENGKFVYPDDIDPKMRVAIASTKAVRDTQRAFTKAQQEAQRLKAEKEALEAELKKMANPASVLSNEELQDLEELKYTDPDMWYQKMRELELKAQQLQEEKLQTVKTKAKQESEYEYRKRLLDEFNKNTDKKLTVEQLEYYIPPIMVKELDEGKIDFNTFLENAQAFIYGNKKVDEGDKPTKTVDMTKTGGGDTIPTTDDSIDYTNIIL